MTVSVECKGSGNDLSFSNCFTIRTAGPGGGMDVVSTGSITAEKRRGKPGWTRIRHHKAVPVRGSAIDGTATDVLSYWIQVETACLLSAT
jgi:hypothetical protein